jgi:hypothetical protein
VVRAAIECEKLDGTVNGLARDLKHAQTNRQILGD